MTSSSFKVRASSWSSLFDCAHRFEAVHILGMKSPSSPRALLGTAIHAGTAAFDTAKMLGAEISASDACDVVAETIARPEEDVSWKGDDLAPKKAIEIGVALTAKYCAEISPRYTFRAVEQETKPLDIDCGNGVVITITGTLDRSRLIAGTGGLGIADLKSGTAAVQNGRAKTKGHAAQVGTYEILYEHTTGESITEPAEIIGLQTSGRPEVAVGEIRDARRIMVGDGESPGLIQYAAEMFRSGLFPPNPSSVLCSEKFCPRWARCKFRDQQ